MKRLLLYVHFNKYGQLSQHVVYQLEQLRPLFERVVFISNSPFSVDNQSKLADKGLINHFIQRENSGFDFAAWRDGMVAEGFDSLAAYDTLTLMNDTCFGPLWDLAPYYEQFEESDQVDFWGMTNNRKTKQFAEHLQSYFLSFGKEVVTSSAFQAFWQGIEDFTAVQDVIDQYETQVTTHFLEAGFQYGAVFDTTKADTTGMLHPDFTIYNPTALLEQAVPFIKVKAFDADQLHAPFILGEIERVSPYPTKLIVDHMSRLFSPTASYLLSRKYADKPEFSPKLADAKIAVHLHTFYVDLLEEFLDAFAHFSFAYDLYLTTDSSEKLAEIEQILAKRGATAELRLTGNVGRDVLPMLKLKDDLAKYDYVGHFHTKKSKEADYWAGQSWRTELIQMMVQHSDQLLSQLAEEPELGLMIADIPSYFRYVRMDPWSELGMIPYMDELWDRMKLTKKPNFYENDVFVMSYGTFVWFKYQALRPLFELDFQEEEVPKEPLPQVTVLHAIERLLVYIAWAQGYDFRISQNQNPIPAFVDNQVLNKRVQEQFSPNAYIDFNQYGGITGAFRYLRKSWFNTWKYIIKRSLMKIGIWKTLSNEQEAG